jgi:hypothetical protein
MSVFLCVKQNINNFDCYKFNNFIEADNYFIKKYNNDTLSTMIVISTMISVSQYLPLFIQKIIIDYKLKKLFVKSKIIS